MQPESFSSLGLSPQSLATLTKVGFTAPTPIQAQAIPHALKGKDVIGCAATGTGKTAAFMLPLIERLAGKRGVRGLVLAPTRELATQISEVAAQLGAGRGVRSALLIGGVSPVPQIQALRSQPLLIIATPGRLIDHLQGRHASLADIEMLVLDEADRMLDMGFKPQLTRILGQLPKTRQTLLFSATMGGEVSGFAKTHLRDPARVEVERSGTTAKRATQLVYRVSQAEKTALLLSILAEDQMTTLVFARTKHRTDKVARSIERAGHRVSRLHSNRSQAQRREALEGFKNGRFRVLVATDIAARGIDVAEIGHVVNFDMPHVAEDYVHRIGRTARAAASGKASSFTAPEESDLLRAIERLMRAPVPRADVPRDSPVFQKAVTQAAAQQADPGPSPSRHGHPHKSGRPQGRSFGGAPKAHASAGQPKSHDQGGASPSQPPRRNGPSRNQRRGQAIGWSA